LCEIEVVVKKLWKLATNGKNGKNWRICVKFKNFEEFCERNTNFRKFGQSCKNIKGIVKNRSKKELF
jgi:hypothetical protein